MTRITIPRSRRPAVGGRRGMVAARAVLAGVIVAAVLSVQAGAPAETGRQGATPTAAAKATAGPLAYARRAYSRLPPPNAPLNAPLTEFSFWVGRYASVAATRQAMAVETGQLEAVGEEPLDVLDLDVDAAAWHVTTVRSGDEDVPMAILVYQDGVYVHFWQAHGPGPDPLPQLWTVTEIVLGPDLRPDPLPAGAPLLDLVPGPRDVPRDFVLRLEEGQGLPGYVPPVAATPTVASPAPDATPDGDEGDGPCAIPTDIAASDASWPARSDSGIDGLVADARRMYSEAPDRGADDALDFVYSWVASFDTVQHAADVADLLTDRYVEAGLAVREVAVAQDRTVLVFRHRLSLDCFEVEVAQLVYRDGIYVHFWVAVDPVANPGPLLEDIAQRVLGREPPPSTATPGEALFALLPGPMDVPPGFRLNSESSEFSAGGGMGTPVATTPEP